MAGRADYNDDKPYKPEEDMGGGGVEQQNLITGEEGGGSNIGGGGATFDPKPPEEEVVVTTTGAGVSGNISEDPGDYGGDGPTEEYVEHDGPSSPAAGSISNSGSSVSGGEPPPPSDAADPTGAGTATQVQIDPQMRAQAVALREQAYAQHGRKLTFNQAYNIIATNAKNRAQTEAYRNALYGADGGRQAGLRDRRARMDAMRTRIADNIRQQQANILSNQPRMTTPETRAAVQMQQRQQRQQRSIGQPYGGGNVVEPDLMGRQELQSGVQQILMSDLTPEEKKQQVAALNQRYMRRKDNLL